MVEGKFKSPFKWTDYELGKVHTSDERLECGCLLGDNGYLWVFHGIHMYVDKMDIVIDYGKTDVHRCIIPAGTRYVQGFGHSGAKQIVDEKVIVE